MIIYKITNLLNNKIYIGQTNGKNKFYFGGGKIIKIVIKKYGRKNFKWETIVEGNFNNVFIDELEKHYIRLHNATNRNVGYNIELGGSQQKNLSEETKIKIGIKSKEKFIKNPNLKELYKKLAYDNLAGWNKNIPMPKHLKINLSNKKKKEWKNNYEKYTKTINNLKIAAEKAREKLKKKVLQYDINNNLIKEFDSIAEAAKSVKENAGNLSTGIKNNKIRKGYYWKLK
jgi:group I intron endonuclease